jgi:hypothetical protein
MAIEASGMVSAMTASTVGSVPGIGELQEKRSS